MSRDIKFRAWHKKQGKMFAVGGLSNMDYDVDSRYRYVTIAGKDAGVLVEEATPQIQDIEIMQYTGLKDKNGKEIYEGDIVNYEALKGQFGLHQIVYVDEAAAFLLQAITPASRNPVGMKYLGDIARSNSQYDTRTYELCEAIGNIYQNKELLNDQQ